MEMTMQSMALCMAAPMLLMLFFVEGQARKQLAFMFLGLLIYGFAADVNDVVRDHMQNYDETVFSCNYAPIVEEIMKMAPVVIWAVIFKERTNELILMGMSTGVGFGMMENVYYMSANTELVADIEWVLIRGFGTALMHAICTAAVGYVLYISYRHRRMYVSGTVAALALAITYHSVYNIMVNTEYWNIIVFMPIVTFAVVLAVSIIRQRKSASDGK